MASREQFLEATIQRAETQLRRLPEGRVSYHQGGIWDYKGPDKSVKTLRKTDPLLADLIQRSYLEKLIRTGTRELKARTGFRKAHPELKIEEVFDQLSDQRKEIIQPLVPTPAQFAEQWQNQPYPSRNPVPLDDKFPTGVSHCPFVRSKSELLEVQQMDAQGVIFLYEFPLVLTDLHGLKKTVYPDFTILVQKTHNVLYWEHFGRIDDPEYLAAFKDKQELYAANGIFGSKLYQTFEYSNRPLTMLEINAAVADIKRLTAW